MSKCYLCNKREGQICSYCSKDEWIRGNRVGIGYVLNIVKDYLSEDEFKTLKKEVKNGRNN